MPTAGGGPANDGTRRGLWPGAVGCALGGVALVTALLLPLDPVARSWTVRGLLVLHVLVGVAFLFRGPARPARSNRPERLLFQTTFVWGALTGATFAVPALGSPEPSVAVLAGAVGSLVFGALLRMLDPWFVRRGLA